MYIAVDVDGTIVEHDYPRLGPPVDGAFDWLRQWQEAGAQLMLWTMRCDGGANGPVLTQAVDLCRQNGIQLYGVNENPDQLRWTLSPKMYAHQYIDDAAFGCPLKPGRNGRPVVDWSVVGPAVLKLLQAARR